MASYRPTIQGHHHMVSAGHYLAAQAGYQILEAGGNAVDAGVASALCLGVVQSDVVNVGGVAPTMIRPAGAPDITVISGVGPWPKATSLEHLAKTYGCVPPGVLRSVIPAGIDVHLTALKRFGTMSFAEVAAPAAAIARDGFVMYPLMANSIANTAADYGSFPSSAAIYLPNGRPPLPGEVFLQSDLARTLQYLADEDRAGSNNGRDAGLAAARAAFYEGDIAGAIADFHAKEGGWITRDDMAGFSVDIESPRSARIGDTMVNVCDGWCQGPVLLQMVNILAKDDLAALGHNSPEYAHLLIEAVRLAFVDRERHYGDPAVTDVPFDRLLSSEHAHDLRARIQADRALSSDEMWAGGVYQPTPKVSADQDTSYTCVVDKDGMVFSCTPSDGSATSPVIPGTGLCASPRGSQSWAIDGHPSSVAPGKRPRLTPNPAIAVRDDGTAIPFGTPGADVQCQAMLQVLLNFTTFGMTAQEAVEAPRFSSYDHPMSFEPHTMQPGVVKAEARLGPDVINSLSAKGHKMEIWEDLDWKGGAVCMIAADPNTGVLSGGADPRRECYALGR